jgi:predicted ATP-grasp superfamily ATP-dependent carboligase
MNATDAFVQEVRQLVKIWRIDVLLPITEAYRLAILREGSNCGEVRIPFVALDAFRRICDKAFVLDEAAAIGIAVPQQRIVLTRERRHTFDGESQQYPVVIKPARSVVDASGKLRNLTVRHASDWPTVQARLDDLPDTAYPVLVQQRVTGPGVGVFLLMWEDETLAFFCHRRIREKPPAGGVSVYCESVSPDPALIAESERLLRRFEWRGVAMVEYKLDSGTGTPYLMEVNGRFWGSLQLAVDSGVDFPALLVRAATGDKPPRVCDYRVGVRSRWLWGEVDHLWARLRRSDTELALPRGSPSRIRAIGDFLTVWRPGDRSQVLRFGDLRPFARETIAWIRRQ